MMKKLTIFLLISVIVMSFNLTGRAQSQTSSNSPATDNDAAQLKNLLVRVSERIQKYQDAMFSIAFTEILQQQELKSDGTAKDKLKEFVYDSVVVSRTSIVNKENSFPLITRTLKTVDGKPTEQKSLKQRSKCTDTNPQPAYGDPLNFLLSKNQKNFTFSYAGEADLDGRTTAILLISTPPASEPVKIITTGNCFRLSRGLQRQGKIWIDLNTFDVMQLQWQLAESFSGKIPAGIAKFGIFPLLRPAREISYDKQEFTMRFREVTFQSPEQILWLPSSSESVWILKGAGIEGFRINTEYTRYKRFITGVEIKDTDEDRQ
jgi:hypothetical protein